MQGTLHANHDISEEKYVWRKIFWSSGTTLARFVGLILCGLGCRLRQRPTPKVHATCG